MLPSPDTFWYLSKLSYIEEKRLVVVEFSNNEKKQSGSFSFFPRVLIPISKATEPIIRQLLNSFGTKKFKAEKKSETVLSVSAKTFSDLKRFCNLLNATIKMQTILLKPEQQFLLSRGWSYFGAFEKTQFGFEKKHSYSIPQVCFDWIGGKLETEIPCLLKKERVIAEKILESITLSNALCLPLQELPQQKALLAETLLQNACFRNDFAPNKELGNCFSSNRFGYYNGNQTGFAELDFSKTWPALFGFHFFNLSFETIDCDCCVPETAFEQNVLPSSTVEVRFAKNGFFFESKTETFSQRFHESSAGKQSRLLRQKEFFLKSIPLGPFDKGDCATVPIEDALQLARDESAEITNAETELHWFCRKHEGLLSKELNLLNKQTVMLSRLLEEKRKTAIIKFGVFSENELFFDAEAVFLQKSIEALSSLLESIPAHLLSPNSQFFDKRLSIAFLAIQSIILKNFRQFSNSKGAKAVPVGSNKCLLSGNQALSISKEFCQKEKLPLPAIM